MHLPTTDKNFNIKLFIGVHASTNDRLTTISTYSCTQIYMHLPVNQSIHAFRCILHIILKIMIDMVIGNNYNLVTNFTRKHFD